MARRLIQEQEQTPGKQDALLSDLFTRRLEALNELKASDLNMLLSVVPVPVNQSS